MFKIFVLWFFFFCSRRTSNFFNFSASFCSISVSPRIHSTVSGPQTPIRFNFSKRDAFLKQYPPTATHSFLVSRYPKIIKHIAPPRPSVRVGCPLSASSPHFFPKRSRSRKKKKKQKPPPPSVAYPFTFHRYRTCSKLAQCLRGPHARSPIMCQTPARSRLTPGSPRKHRSGNPRRQFRQRLTPSGSAMPTTTSAALTQDNVLCKTRGPSLRLHELSPPLQS